MGSPATASDRLGTGPLPDARNTPCRATNSTGSRVSTGIPEKCGVFELWPVEEIGRRVLLAAPFGGMASVASVSRRGAAPGLDPLDEGDACELAVSLGGLRREQQPGDAPVGRIRLLLDRADHLAAVRQLPGRPAVMRGDLRARLVVQLRLRAGEIPLP